MTDALSKVCRDAALTVRGLITAMERLGHERLAGDDPALYWLEDWETLLRLREAYAADLLAGRTPRLDVPAGEDGRPISRRMSELEGCQVAQRLWELP
ncbi:hypothetical protein N865_10455 [Intrasporangium oryzae NRRL B-24470]|uniref:Uncharacterized protein n=1 Tax=Intrasporangium oryzae NRRL B-24470 TaxID=1386089 RepID=W9GC83_9MICO|nr:hypothetical protein [Intrasporangium oryzae]EWT01459.1 hypothetical protein N865_10455 [Intrasporangium oryzae NRRL B-24470]